MSKEAKRQQHLIEKYGLGFCESKYLKLKSITAITQKQLEAKIKSYMKKLSKWDDMVISVFHPNAKGFNAAIVSCHINSEERKR